MVTNQISWVFLNFSSSQIPQEDPLEEEEEDKEDEAKKENSVNRSTAVDANPQLVEEKKSSGCSLCNLL